MNASQGSRTWLLFAVGIALLLPAVARTLLADVTGVQQILKVAPDKVDFGAVPVGTRTQPQTVTLTNSGNAPLRIAGILVSGIDFAQSNNCGMQLAAGAQCSVQITFQPAILGPRLGTAIITTTNDPGSPNLLVLNGVGE
jgi:HYDIN/CFA65/VesB family protein